MAEGLETYRQKYIVTGSFAPIVHLLAFVGGVSYIREFSHLRDKKAAERDAHAEKRLAAKKAEAHHH
jgi:hypothetical protein